MCNATNVPETTDSKPEAQTHYVKDIYFSLTQKEKAETQEKLQKEVTKATQDVVDQLCHAINESEECILMDSKWYYWKKLNALLPPPEFNIPDSTVFYHYKGDLFKPFMAGARPLLYSEAKAIQDAHFDALKNKKKQLPFLGENYRAIACFSPGDEAETIDGFKRHQITENTPCSIALSLIQNHSSSYYEFNGSVKETAKYLPIFRLSGQFDIPQAITDVDIIKNWLKNDLCPHNKQLKTAINYLKNIPYQWSLSSSGKVTVSIVFDDDSVLLKALDPYTLLKQKLLECDKIRVALDPYDEQLLTDIGRGHWDLWETHDQTGELMHLKENQYLVARNPEADIYDGVIAIDFGTKSTVVVRLEKNDSISPMRVGLGNLSKKAEAKHYENPTVMEFTDLNSFLSDYNSRQGRPFTDWNDLTISHSAANSLLDSQSSDYHAFVSELKQWAGDRKKILTIQDKKHPDIHTIKPFCELQEGDLDPIEYYAYLLGLNINNMIQGVHLDYVLSFPVTYEENIRQRILNSFTRGLKKSLPQSLLEDPEVMERFSVVAGASEPAAYAICALKEYGFNPAPGERVAFSVFDFGGGTTDFDYGIWRAAGDDRKERRFDNVIEHYGAGGDSRLGGENILERLAYETFVLNEDKMRSLNASFVCPSNCNPPAGFEKLVNNSSQEARLNTKLLMEVLRDFWERRDGFEKMFDGKSEITLSNIYDNKGNPKANQSLTVSQERLEKVEHDLISNGIEQFFYKMQQTFDKNALIKGISSIQIFLAGNSCKSKVLRELFEAKIEEENKKIIEKYPDQEFSDSFYCLYPPLGSDEAMDIQQQKNCISEYSVPPTGKTGVAFGLIHCRAGSRVKVVDKSLDETGEIDFRYFLGNERRGILKYLLQPGSKYGEWKLLYQAEERTFEIYYTTLAAAGTGNLSIKTEGVIRKRITIKPEPAACIFLRAVSPTKIEYMIAFDDKDEQPGEIVQQPQVVDLEERK